MRNKKGDYIKSLRKFIEGREKSKKRRRLEIIEKVRESAPLFLERFPDVTEIALVGSVAKERFYTSKSDADILLTGLNNRDYFKAHKFWDDVLKMDIDLIRREEIDKKREYILKDRLVIYERD